MKRFLLLVVTAAMTAGVIWFALRWSHRTSSAAVTALLPKETLVLVHLPDFSQSRTEFHRTDIYQLWKEPAVQDFLQKPRTKISPGVGLGQTVQDCEALEMKDAFIAVISLEYSAWKTVAGFRYKGDPANAEKIVANWRTKLLGQGSDYKQESINYEGHQVLTESAGIVNLSSVRAGEWFFFANDREQLKPLLDRFDGRQKDPKTSLTTDEAFVAASKHMPASYDLLAYARVDQFVRKLTPLEEKDATADQTAFLRQLRAFCGATSFDGGRIRDTVFVGMPKMGDAGKLLRVSLPIGTKETFLYAAGLLNFSNQMQLSGPQGVAGRLGGLQKITDALSASGITMENWNAAVGPEFGLVGDWPANSHWPSLVATLPVKDAAKANQILTAITTAPAQADDWVHQEKDGVHYFSTKSGGQLFSFSPTVALSDRMLVAGADAASVEAALKRSASGSSGLAATKNFQNAERTVPTGRQAFTYIDPALLYTRVDATLRPMLFMGAAFLPGLSETVELNKLPDPEVITKHLSPIVMSQSYEGDGYVSQSVGPVTMYQTAVGAVGFGAAATLLYRQQGRWLNRGSSLPAAGVPPAAPPLLSPSPTPKDSP